jgi:hypothetical protein
MNIDVRVNPNTYDIESMSREDCETAYDCLPFWFQIAAFAGRLQELNQISFKLLAKINSSI